MTNIIKEKAGEILDVIKESENILLHLHPKPDPDSFGSALAMKFILEKMDKKATVIKGDTSLSESFNFLPGYGDIVEKNYFEIEKDEFDLFIILDSGSRQMISREGEIEFPENLKTIVIDHHKTNENYADINLVSVESSSTSELVFDLATEWGIDIDENIANNILIGIYGDTGGFRHPNTTSHTFKVASVLTEISSSFSSMISSLNLNKPIDLFYFTKLALNNLELHFDNRVAITTVSLDEMEKENIDPEKVSGNDIPNTFISFKDWEVGISLSEKEENKIGISFRSKSIDVSKIAQELGGGGHELASGALLECSIEEAKKQVLEAVGKHLK